MPHFCGRPYRYLGTASSPAEMIAKIEQARAQEQLEAAFEEAYAELNEEELMEWLEGGESEKGKASQDLESSSPD